MRQYKILVSGVGAIIGYGVIQSLRKSRYACWIVGMDIYADAVGQVWCDEFIQAIPASDERYISFLSNVISQYGIDLVFFGTEQEIQKCNQCRSELGDCLSKLVLNREELISMAEDKWETACFLEKHGFHSIPGSITYNFAQAKDAFGLPLLLKPRRSYASKGICKAFTIEEFDEWKKIQGDQFMVQMWIGDDNHEYTVATFGFGDGTCIDPIIMRRKLSKAGATDKAFIECLPELSHVTRKLVSVLKPIGPTNFQFRLHEGEYLLLEVNPRISSSTSIRTAFGYNEAEMCIEFYLEKSQPGNKTIKSGYAFRYITEVVKIDENCNNL